MVGKTCDGVRSARVASCHFASVTRRMDLADESFGHSVILKRK